LRGTCNASRRQIRATRSRLTRKPLWFTMVAGLGLGLPHDPVMLAAMAFGLAMRLLALRFDWHMPKFVYSEALH
jgi:uncharacterized membrane protein YeiH